MKKILCLTTGLIFVYFSIAQSIQVAADKTTALIFPLDILHVDRGTQDILVQTVKESENIILVKAATKDFNPTNLSIITTDGSLYSMAVQYSANPQSMVYRMPVQKSSSMETYANGIVDNRRTLWGVQDRKWNMTIGVIGIYIKDKTMYYQLRIHNQSTVDYDIDFLRFYIRDKRTSKRTATQEIELNPLLIVGNTRQVKAGTINTLVIALEKFTIPDAKYLAIEINEQNGGRHLSMQMGNKKILHSIILPDLK